MTNLRIVQILSVTFVVVCLVSISTIAGFGVMLIATCAVGFTIIVVVTTGLLMETKGGRR